MLVMIENQSYLSNDEYLITPSLINSWLYIWQCEEHVKESEKDTICLEDKKQDARKKAFDDFIKTLKREPFETNQYMQAGIDFEEECYNGNVEEVSPIIEGGIFQMVGKKHVVVNGIKLLMYGRLDVLKGGVIYDIKKVIRYAPQKYLKSSQHPFYLELFRNANKFVYLVHDTKLHKETYYRDECESIYVIISNFLNWLIATDYEGVSLIKIYQEYWKSKGEK